MTRETPTPPSACPLELISIHVPKTAGSSFQRILRQVYPGAAFKPIYGEADGVVEIIENRLPPLDPAVRAIHGHFPATPALRDGFPGAKMIAWVREPVARTLSYYSFWRRTPRHGNPLHDEFLDRGMSLVEFARHPAMDRELVGYFERVALEDFFFIGLMERFDADARLLAERLGWPPPEVPRENVTRERPAVSEDERRAVAAAMAGSIDLYRRIKALRGLD